jgi:hypothetical protein
MMTGIVGYIERHIDLSEISEYANAINSAPIYCNSDKLRRKIEMMNWITNAVMYAWKFR